MLFTLPAAQNIGLPMVVFLSFVLQVSSYTYLLQSQHTRSKLQSPTVFLIKCMYAFCKNSPHEKYHGHLMYSDIQITDGGGRYDKVGESRITWQAMLPLLCSNSKTYSTWHFSALPIYINRAFMETFLDTVCN